MGLTWSSILEVRGLWINISKRRGRWSHSEKVWMRSRVPRMGWERDRKLHSLIALHPRSLAAAFQGKPHHPRFIVVEVKPSEVK